MIDRSKCPLGVQKGLDLICNPRSSKFYQINQLKETLCPIFTNSGSFTFLFLFIIFFFQKIKLNDKKKLKKVDRTLIQINKLINQRSRETN